MFRGFIKKTKKNEIRIFSVVNPIWPRRGEPRSLHFRNKIRQKGLGLLVRVRTYSQVPRQTEEETPFTRAEGVGSGCVVKWLTVRQGGMMNTYL